MVATLAVVARVRPALRDNDAHGDRERARHANGHIHGRRHAASQQNQRSPGLRRAAAAAGHTATTPASGCEQRLEGGGNDQTMKPERKPQLSTEIHASTQERNNMRKLMSIALFVVCCTGLT